MNLSRTINYIFGLLFTLIVLGGCNGGAPQSNSNTSYGQLISAGIAESNPVLEGETTLSTDILNGTFPDDIVNAFTSEPGLQQQNKTYINTTSALFGIIAPNNIGNYVSNNAAISGVSAIQLQQVTYTTPGAPYMFGGRSVSKEIASGLVIMPGTCSLFFGFCDPGTFSPLAESQIKGVVLYYHPTVLSKAGIPSGYGNIESLDYEETAYTQAELASVYASSGYIVIAPDYVGQGIDSAVVHPYVLFPETNAQSGIYM